MIAQSEIEFNIEWIRKFPELFSKKLNKWHNESKSNGLVSFHMNLDRPGFITYVARKVD